MAAAEAEAAANGRRLQPTPKRKPFEVTRPTCTPPCGMEELPIEVLWRIADLLDVATVWSKWRLVSTRFFDALGYSTYWKRRLRALHDLRLPKRHLRTSTNRFVDFAARFEVEAKWPLSFALEPTSTQAHFAAVDAIRLSQTGDLCATGARDSSLSIWKLGGKPKKLHEIKQAHTQWIWSVEWEANERLVSAGFDHFVRQWRLEDGGRPVAEAACCLNSPVLWSKRARGVRFSSTCDSCISITDERNWNEVVCRLTFHSTPVIDAVIEESSPFFYTLSEHSLACGDSRMWAKLSEFKWPSPNRSVVKCGELLFVGGVDEAREHSLVRPIDPITSNLLPELEFEAVGAARLAAAASTFALLGGRSVRVLSGDVEPKVLWRSAELADGAGVNLDYVAGRLAATTANGRLLTFGPSD